MSTMKAFTVIAALVCGLTWGACADGQESDELVTDRPDFTESPLAVPYKSLQLESGVTWEHANEHSDVVSGPELLLRWGIAKNFELRLGLPNFIGLSGTDDATGIGDSSVGAKVQLGQGFAEWNIACMATLSLPTGDEEFSSDSYDPQLMVMAGRDLGSTGCIGGQLAASWPDEDDDREFVWGGTLVVGTAMGERWCSFFELAADVIDADHVPALFHHGYAYSVSPNTQLDVHGGIGISGSAPDALLGGGFSVRF
jgi:hypothetical protein